MPSSTKTCDASSCSGSTMRSRKRRRKSSRQDCRTCSRTGSPSEGNAMRFHVAFLAITLITAVISAQSGSFYDLKTKTLLGKDGDLAQYRGKVSLVVNVASKCGFTPQYEGLERLQREMKGKPFNVL